MKKKSASAPSPSVANKKTVARASNTAPSTASKTKSDASSSRRPIKRIAVNTGGGDAPGLNAVIRAIVHAATKRGWEVVGIRDGFDGIIKADSYADNSGIIPLTRSTVKGITHKGGTILGTTNRGNPMRFPMQKKDGTWHEVDRTPEILKWFKKNKVDALLAIGGDGSLTIANHLAKQGLRVVGIPKTIDNDLDKTHVTFGFDTAISFATECIDRLHSTAEAHHRVIVVEVMGRYAGWIALHAGIAGTADVILIPEIPYDIENIAGKIREREKAGRSFSIIVVAEGAKPKGGSTSVIDHELGRAERIGGAGERVTKEIEARTGKEARLVVLGHLQRGGSPTAYDRLLSLRFGTSAVRALADGESNVMVASAPPRIITVPLKDAIDTLKLVSPDSDIVQTARDLSISFGD
jgi:phosphofructokinase-like protein